jgi:hypothetical protein
VTGRLRQRTLFTCPRGRGAMWERRNGVRAVADVGPCEVGDGRGDGRSSVWLSLFPSASGCLQRRVLR